MLGVEKVDSRKPFIKKKVRTFCLTVSKKKKDFLEGKNEPLFPKVVLLEKKKKKTYTSFQGRMGVNQASAMPKETPLKNERVCFYFNSFSNSCFFMLPTSNFLSSKPILRIHSPSPTSPPHHSYFYHYLPPKPRPLQRQNQIPTASKGKKKASGGKPCTATQTPKYIKTFSDSIEIPNPMIQYAPKKVGVLAKRSQDLLCPPFILRT